ncbi:MULTISPECIES: carboxymuconolactone decarboxylase family protein [Actinomadura]|uniref:Carboxymuconolactone decarboxylase family protein n=1 Tax=Actinomadura litoris TaxID=2678616 RepID=A0A7K1KUE7_9ACTN|nr:MULTISPECIES: carboxymuconolactone decarboxylase family protein [Actinomadura]MBT2207390.1 carboxymuconolactone decarboxylase family protein [Actinomadura sp. NEAU-AAG7]MUN35801.1 carboxymuconolactone decarboxylase family protein [Actinomadura litoris]
MQARMKNPAFVLPDVTKGVGTLSKAIAAGGVPEGLMEIIALRASQINGCSVCVHGHVLNARKAGESEERIAAVGAWREAPFFTDAERAALSLAEHATRLADRSDDAVPDALWNELTAHFEEKELAAIILLLGMINMFNRLNAIVREPAGTTW